MTDTRTDSDTADGWEKKLKMKSTHTGVVTPISYDLGSKILTPLRCRGCNEDH